ncbi:TPA: hypothetical protein ACGPMP_002018 [Enterobacter roggenkampii]
MNRLKIVERETPLEAPSKDEANPNGTGGGGGGRMEDIVKRVERLESALTETRLELVKLSTRSESFVTKENLLSTKGELKDALQITQEAIIKKIDDRFKDIEEKARWKWGTVVIPLSVGIAGVLATLLVAHFSS